MIKLGLIVVGVVAVLLFLEGQGETGLVADFATNAGEFVTDAINWISGGVEQVSENVECDPEQLNVEQMQDGSTITVPCTTK
jgi:hypothetical protein